MKKFVFYTLEGYTESPTEKPVENIQVLGFEEGNSMIEAKQNLLKNRPWIIERGFDEKEIVCKQLLDDKTKDLIKTIIDYNWNEERRCYEECEKEYSIPNHIFLILKELKDIIE